MKRFQITSRILGAFVAAAVVLVPMSMAHAGTAFGVLGGVNLAKIDFDPDGGAEFNSRPGFVVGGLLDLGIDEMVSVLIQPMVIQKGTEIEAGGQDQGKIKLIYFAIPALVKFAFGSSSTRPYVLAGPEIGFKMSAKAEDPDGTETDIDESVKSTDFGAAVGGGIDFAAGGNLLFVEGRYGAGFTDINDAPADDPDIGGVEIKTRGIQILGGITFPIGGGDDDYE